MADPASNFVRDVIAQASEFGLTWWERLALILVLALLTVLGKKAVMAIRLAPVPPEWDPEKGTGPLSPPIPVQPDGSIHVPPPSKDPSDPSSWV